MGKKRDVDKTVEGVEHLLRTTPGTIYYELVEDKLNLRFDDDTFIIEKWIPERAISAVYYDGVKERFMVKRFLAEPSSKRVHFITEHEDSELYIATTYAHPEVLVEYDKRSSAKEDETYDLEDVISVKGVNAVGNRFIAEKPKTFSLIEQEVETDEEDAGIATAKGIESAASARITKPVTKQAKKSDGTAPADLSKDSELKVDQQTEEAVVIELDVEPDTKDKSEENKQAAKPKKKKDSSSDDEGQISLF